MKHAWKAVAPVAVTVITALLPPPAGLPPHAWYYFAIFLGVIVGLMFEPLPGGAIGLIGVTVAAVFSEVVFFSPRNWHSPGSVPHAKRWPGRCRDSRTRPCG